MTDPKKDDGWVHEDEISSISDLLVKTLAANRIPLYKGLVSMAALLQSMREQHGFVVEVVMTKKPPKSDMM